MAFDAKVGGRQGVARLTTALVRGMEHDGRTARQYRVFDDPTGRTYIPGFFIYVFPTGRKTYMVRVPKRYGGKRTEVALGDAAIMTAEQARSLAISVLRGETPATSAHAPAKRDQLTVRQACDRFLSEYRTAGKGRAIKDSAAWRANLRRLSDALGSLALEDLTAAKIQPIIDGFTQATARVCKSNWSTLWDHAIAERWIANLPNPLRRVTTAGCEVTIGKRKRALGDREIAACIAAAEQGEDPILPLYLRILAMTGHRPGELVRATWEDNAPSSGRVLVRETKKNKPLHYPPERSQELASVMGELAAKTGSMTGMFSATPDNVKATDLQYRGLARSFAAAVKRAGLDAGIKLSHFRSTLATRAYREAHEKAVKAAQATLDHADARVTADSYIVSH